MSKKQPQGGLACFCYNYVSDKPINITPHARSACTKERWSAQPELVELAINDTHSMNENEQMEWMREHQRNWRSWGSWFSWGSPVGLGIWFVLMAAAFWIIMQAI